MKRRLLPYSFLAGSLALAAWLLSQVRLAELSEILEGFHVLGFVLALTIYALLNVVRAARFRVLLPDGGGAMGLLIPITFYHNALVRVLPMRTGELSFLYFARRYLRTPLMHSTAALFLSRLIEMLLIVGVGIGALLLSSRVDGGSLLRMPSMGDRSTMARAGLAAAVLAPVLLALGFAFRESWARLVTPIWRQGRAYLAEIAMTGRLASLLLLSVLAYGLSLYFYVNLITFLDLPLTLPTMIFAISVYMCATNAPFTLAGIGLAEGAWAYSSSLVGGLPADRMIAVGFLLHGMQLACVAITGVVGAVWLHFAVPERPR